MGIPVYAWLKKHQKEIDGIWSPLSTIFANTIIVLTVVLALATYYQAQGLGQVEASLGYIDTFNGGEVLEARNLVYKSWLPYDFSGNDAGISREVIDALLDRVVPNIGTLEGLEHRLAVAVIVAFFDSAEVCIAQSACSASVLEAQVGEYGRDFYCLYQPIIDREKDRGKLVAFGAGLRSVALRMGGC
ncbi:hypothetical protein SAMN05428969_0239 [Devosia sp. YR412]|uniref:hypothetical protein n=1 Tax=Devosia sp. YR412 TaxID=1881030 RepID=UPI0008C8B434|nr:hypothetical protein [Devosia sp. YR412]SEP63534.1 hypothetical protein SAMN05428969_0239 [Devosia sp. YR412]